MTTNGSRAAAAATAAFVLMIAAILASFVVRPSVALGWDYAVLSLPESHEDRAAVAALSSAGFGGVVSESTQWVYLDDFGGLERVPLDRYRGRVETFDPRDDGYADLLRSLFVSDGRRRLFVPNASPTRLRVVAALFEGSDFSLLMPPRSAVGIPDMALFVVAALVTLLLGGAPSALAAAIPALASLACFGPAGFAASSLLAASIRAVVDPARESLRVGRGEAKRRDHPWLFDGLPQAIVFGAGALAACALGGIPIVPTLCSVSAGIMAAFAVVVVQEYLRGERGHARFVPVNLDHRFVGTIRASRAALPFAAAALVSLALSATGVGAKGGEIAPSPTVSLTAVTLDEYRTHMDFQRSFSVSRLGSLSSRPYGRYSIESDGLVASGSERGNVPDLGKLDLPPAERMLSRATPVGGALGSQNSQTIGTIVALATAFAAASPAVAYALRARARARSIESIADKRIAA